MIVLPALLLIALQTAPAPPKTHHEFVNPIWTDGNISTRCAGSKLSLKWSNDPVPHLTHFSMNERTASKSDLAVVNQHLANFESQLMFFVECGNDDVAVIQVYDKRALRRDASGHITLLNSKLGLKIDPDTMKD